MVHRDIKPENILISQDDIIKLADFGVSYLIPNGQTDQLSTTIGTKAYLCPEAYKGTYKKPFNYNLYRFFDKGEIYQGFLSDIWSLGVTLYYFLHGKLPFFDQNLVKLKEKIKNDPLILDETLPFPLKDLMIHCLEKNPLKRMNLKELMVKRVFFFI